MEKHSNFIKRICLVALSLLLLTAMILPSALAANSSPGHHQGPQITPIVPPENVPPPGPTEPEIPPVDPVIPPAEEPVPPPVGEEMPVTPSTPNVPNIPQNPGAPTPIPVEPESGNVGFGGNRIEPGSSGNGAGNGYYAIIFQESENGSVVPETGMRTGDDVREYIGIEELYITPHAQRNDNIHNLSDGMSRFICSGLDNAYEALTTLPDLGEICPDLNEIAHSIHPEYDSSVFVVGELFDITMTTALYQQLQQGDRYARLTFDSSPDWSQERVPTVMYYNEFYAKWCSIASDLVHVNEDNSLTVDFYNICPVAFLYVNEERAAELKAQPDHPASCHCPNWCPFCQWLCFPAICICWIVIPIMLFIIWRVYKELTNDEEDPEAEEQEESNETVHS